MAKPNSERRRFRLLRRATRIKGQRFTWSGLILIVVGIAVINFGLALATGANSVEGLLLGAGAILALVGILRVLIGVINPATPQDLDSATEVTEEPKTVEEVVMREQ
ncbi:MAG: hypothetical protein JO183_09865 [Ktedonobacteraceae bacterium]|nr:hypothetical protein [Ktedonobacteraceae bacterium]MBV8822158.1 hypothetical protein [Ktedonobacteraceae bacterium]MBV9021778.1 hypothetical protein [Ktedonobacteraceae bacterium]